MDLHQFFLFLAIILIAARVLSETVARFGIPSVIGELLAGLLVGPSLLGWVTPDTTMKLLAEIGIILLLFEVGMDTNLSRLARSGSKPYIVAVVGFTLPFAFGYGVSAWLFGLPALTSLFIGGTLTATSIGITVRVLDDLGKRQSDEAQIVVGAAVLDDILGVLALAFLYQFAVEQQVSVKALGEVSLYIVLFMVLAPLVAKLAAGIIDRLDQQLVGRRNSEVGSGDGVGSFQQEALSATRRTASSRRNRPQVVTDGRGRGGRRCDEPSVSRAQHVRGCRKRRDDAHCREQLRGSGRAAKHDSF